MANLAASDVTVTFNAKRRHNGRNYFDVTLAFGNGAKTYPAGGVPISLSAVGCPNVVESLEVFDMGISAYLWSYSASNKTLTAVVGSPLAEISGTAIVAQTLKCELVGW